MSNVRLILFWFGVSILATSFFGWVGLGITLIALAVIHSLPSSY